MIIKIHRGGKSFAGVVRYISHDVGKDSAERVAWTSTLNLADDDLPSAVNEMLWTYRAADALKRASGISTGGSRLERPVKHFSIGWHASEQPTPEHMLETVRDYLKHMGWDDRQAILVAHNDKEPLRHVHVVLNVVSPENGRALKDSHERLRTEDFCLAYEREHGKIFCEQRLKPREERTPTPTRETWEQLRSYEKEDDRKESERLAEPFDYFERGGDAGANAREWTALKDYQKEERMAFFAEGKEAYRQARNAAYREVRTEFKNQWATYYDAKQRGMDKESLAEMKADIIARQKAELDARRDAACNELRTCRDWDYEQIKRRQQEQRAELHERQQLGLRSYHLIDPPGGREPAIPDYRQLSPDRPEPEGKDWDPANAFRSAAKEVCSPTGEARTVQDAPDVHGGSSETPALDIAQLLRPVGAIGGLGLGALGALATIGERLFDGFFGGGEASKPRQPEPHVHPETERQHRARRAASVQSETEAHVSEEARLQAYWEERRGRRRERD